MEDIAYGYGWISLKIWIVMDTRTIRKTFFIKKPHGNPSHSLLRLRLIEYVRLTRIHNERAMCTMCHRKIHIHKNEELVNCLIKAGIIPKDMTINKITRWLESITVQGIGVHEGLGIGAVTARNNP